MGRKIYPTTDFLFARPAFLEGLARLADFFGVLQEYNTSSTPTAADLRAIRADWEAVSADLWTTLNHTQPPQAPSNGRR